MQALEMADYARVRQRLLPAAPIDLPACLSREIEFAERRCPSSGAERLFPIRLNWTLEAIEQRRFGYAPLAHSLYHPEITLGIWERAARDSSYRRELEHKGFRFDFAEMAMELTAGWNRWPGPPGARASSRISWRCEASAWLPARPIEGAPRARVITDFLRQRVLPFFRKAGHPLQRVLTDRGSEFKGAFDQACRTLDIRHTRTQPRHAFTNGFVERLQQTILHEHWRIEFRRRYFTRLAHLDASLQSFLRFYNYERTHHGYRTRGRTPASIVLAANEG